MSVVIKVENISKLYRLGEVGTGTLSHDLNRMWAKVRGKEDPFAKVGQVNDRSQKAESDYVWSLKDINFEIEQGDVVGIIGKNGAGKSTLLKIISQITSPTTGQIKVKGRIASLLEVGTGMHPEMTARENIFLNGAILGMTKKEIQNKFDEIIDFSGCALYVDTPIKRFSSGMKVRLGFAVAAFLEPEILIVDEVLAVGDAEFQKKAIGKMQDVSKNDGRTVLFVSHNMAAISNLCNQIVLLDKGTLNYIGEVQKGINTYFNFSSLNIIGKWKNNTVTNKQCYFDEVEIELLGSQPELELIINFSIINSEKIKSSFVAFDIKNSIGVTIMQAIPEYNSIIKFDNNKQYFKCSILLKGLIPDTYFISCWIGPHYTDTFDFIEDILSFEIIDGPIEGRSFPYNLNHGSVIPFSKLIKL